MVKPQGRFPIIDRLHGIHCSSLWDVAALNRIRRDQHPTEAVGCDSSTRFVGIRGMMTLSLLPDLSGDVCPPMVVSDGPYPLSERDRTLHHPRRGGSNGYRLHGFKLELQKFADETGLTIRVSHFPPGTSKWNRIEHECFRPSVSIGEDAPSPATPWS